MAGDRRIEWTDATWNPVTGCTRSVRVVKTVTRIGWRAGFMLWGRRDTGIISPLLYSRMYLTSPAVESAAEDLRQFDERPFPSRRAP